MRNLNHAITIHKLYSVTNAERGNAVLTYSLCVDTALRAVRRKEPCVAQLQRDADRAVSTGLQIREKLRIVQKNEAVRKIMVKEGPTVQSAALSIARLIYLLIAKRACAQCCLYYRQ